jgi:hypothetical protein
MQLDQLPGKRAERLGFHTKRHFLTFKAVSFTETEQMPEEGCGAGCLLGAFPF